MKQVFTKFLGKQQYLYIALAIIGMCFAGASMVFAQDAATEDAAHAANPPTAAEIDARDAALRAAMDERDIALEALRTERMKEIEMKRTEITVRVNERRAAFSAEVQERIRIHAAALAERLDNVIDRLNAIIERVESRMAKIAERGVDTNEAEGFTAEAKRALNEASVLLEGIGTEVEYTITSDNPRADWGDAKETFREVYRLIQEAHVLLRQAIASLAASVGAQPVSDATNEASMGTDGSN